jgi:hypothetical protein
MEAAPLNCSVRAVTHLSSAAHDSEWLIIQEWTSTFNHATHVRVEPDEALSSGWPSPILVLSNNGKFSPHVLLVVISKFVICAKKVFIFFI